MLHVQYNFILLDLIFLMQGKEYRWSSLRFPPCYWEKGPT